MARRALYLVIIMLLVIMAVPVQASEGGYTLGVSLPATTGVFYEIVSESAQAAADEAGAELVVLASDYDLEAELANVQDLIDQGVDALLFSPTDPVDSVAAVELANEAGLPVFVLGNLAPAEDAEVEIAGTFTTDSGLAGEHAGEAICTSLEGSGAVLEIASLSDDDMSIMAERSTGFDDYMAESCADVTITTVNVFGLGFDDALDAILDALDAGEFDAIVSLDDETTLLAISANDIFRPKNLAVVGIGTHPDLLSSLEQGKLAATIFAEPLPLGQVSVETALAYLNGEAVELTVDAALITLNADNVEALRASSCRGKGC
jgi:ribose transport system substrate-binding protein